MGDGSYSIDQQRYNFQFGGQTFWEIKNGKVGGCCATSPINRARPTSGAPATGWAARRTYGSAAAFNDGKGEPTQSNAVSHGCPVARFRQINVLNTGAKRGRA